MKGYYSVVTIISIVIDFARDKLGERSLSSPRCTLLSKLIHLTPDTTSLSIITACDFKKKIFIF